MPFFYLKIGWVYDHFLRLLETPNYPALATPGGIHPAVVTLVTYLKISANAARQMTADDVVDTLSIIFTESVNTQRAYKASSQRSSKTIKT